MVPKLADILKYFVTSEDYCYIGQYNSAGKENFHTSEIVKFFPVFSSTNGVRMIYQKNIIYGLLLILTLEIAQNISKESIIQLTYFC